MARKPLWHLFGILGLALLVVVTHAPSARGADARMSRAESQLVVAQFFDGIMTGNGLDQVCSDSVVVAFANTGQSLVGINLAQQAFDQLMQSNNATDATIESLIVGEGNASAEIALTGNVLDANGTIAEPGRVVRKNYSVFIDMTGGKITSLHIYGYDKLITLNNPEPTDNSYYPVQQFPGKPY